MKKLICIVLCCLMCTSCDILMTVSDDETQTETPRIVETTKAVKKNSYYRYPLNQLSVQEVTAELEGIWNSLLDSKTLKEFKSKLPCNPVSVSGENGITYNFLDDYNYCYSDDGLIDNIEKIQLNVLETNGEISYTEASTVKIFCVFDSMDTAKEVYSELAETFNQIYVVDSDHRSEDVWTMFVEEKNSVRIPLSLYQNHNNGSYKLEVEFPLFQGKLTI